MSSWMSEKIVPHALYALTYISFAFLEQSRECHGEENFNVTLFPLPCAFLGGWKKLSKSIRRFSTLNALCFLVYLLTFLPLVWFGWECHVVELFGRFSCASDTPRHRWSHTIVLCQAAEVWCHGKGFDGAFRRGCCKGSKCEHRTHITRSIATQTINTFTS